MVLEMPQHIHMRTYFLQPVPTVAVNIEIEDVKGAEFIPLETMTCSPPQEESSLHTTQSRLPLEPQESSPLQSSLHPHTSTSKQKEKPRRRRASSKPVMGTLDVSETCASVM